MQYSVREIIGKSGTNYGMGVYLDSSLLTGLTDKERVLMVKEYVKKIGGSNFTAYDKNGKAVTVHIAKAAQKFINKNGKQQYVNKDLTSYLQNEIKQESVVLIDELVENARHNNTRSSKYPHDWIDNHGKNNWEYWKVYIQEKNKTVWEATLDIATSANGEKILYDIYPINMVERSVTSDTTSTINMAERSVTSDATSTIDIIHNSFEKIKEQTVNNYGDNNEQDSDRDGAEARPGKVDASRITLMKELLSNSEIAEYTTMKDADKDVSTVTGLWELRDLIMEIHGEWYYNLIFSLEFFKLMWYY